MLQNIPTSYLVLGGMAALVLAIVALIFALIAVISAARVQRRFRRWKQLQRTADLDEVFASTVEEVSKLRAELASVRAELGHVRAALEHKISTARVLRYNAFADTGSDLSFSVALLDDRLNGVVLSSIYGREESRMYAKPVEGGKSRYVLTDEERAVIDAAMHGGLQAASTMRED
ncbi:MAG: DUF4446 family protein [Thermoflavifilum sp.]|nr:DUF4446 family protein [Thermoflavifilum sp.]MCL6513099.1 DUF4446 family protein [Alicyclobacillus sp.]